MAYPVGAYFVTPVSGVGGFLIGLGQALAGAPSRYEHAGILISADGATVEAEPGGARIGHITAYPAALVCDGPVQQALAAPPRNLPPTYDYESYLRARLAGCARALVGTPYSFVDYLALAALHLHLPSRAVRNRVERSGHMICSQLVDACYRRCSVQLFTDGRLPGDVMPADLARWAEDWEARRVAA